MSNDLQQPTVEAKENTVDAVVEAKKVAAEVAVKTDVAAPKAEAASKVEKPQETAIIKPEDMVRPTFTVEGRRQPGKIQYGDTVVAYASPSKIQFFVVTEGKILTNAFGRFSHNAMVGIEWGTRIVSDTGKGFIYLVYPTPELWTRGLPHRTQILYMPDISMISQYLDLRPGCSVVESGTGSGSFSHSIARTIAPNGHLYTFEFNEERYQFAQREFARHGFGEDLISTFHSDVCTSENVPGDKEKDIPGKGFWGLENIANSVFLDLPSPWLAIGNAKKLFKKGVPGKICCFSPCIEQVVKTCSALEAEGFSDIKMFEVLIHPVEVRKYAPMKPISFERKNPANTKAAEKSKKEQEEAADKESNKRPLEEETTEETVKSKAVKSGESHHQIKVLGNEKRTVNVSRYLNEIAGHTSFLTFAVYNPEVEDVMALKAQREASKN